MNVVHQLVAHVRYIFQRSKIIRKEWFELLDQHTTQINFGYSLPDLVCLCSANKTFAKMPSPTTCSMSYSAATSVTWWLLIFKKWHFTQRFVYSYFTIQEPVVFFLTHITDIVIEYAKKFRQSLIFVKHFAEYFLPWLEEIRELYEYCSCVSPIYPCFLAYLRICY